MGLSVLLSCCELILGVTFELLQGHEALSPVKMLFPILLQTGFAAYLGSRQYKLLIKALQLPEPGLEIK